LVGETKLKGRQDKVRIYSISGSEHSALSSTTTRHASSTT
jgi:hypothetical protein